MLISRKLKDELVDTKKQQKNKRKKKKEKEEKYKSDNKTKPYVQKLLNHPLSTLPMMLTSEAMPLVDGEEAVGGDGDDGGIVQARLSVSGYTDHRRVGGKLQHHDYILLHLIRKHQRSL